MRSTCCGVFRNWESKQLFLVVSISEKLAPISGKLLFRHNSLSHSLIMLSPGSCLQVCLLIFVPNNINSGDRGASLRLGGEGGGTISDSILGGTRQFFYEVFIIHPYPYFAVPELVSHSAAEQLHRY